MDNLFLKRLVSLGFEVTRDIYLGLAYPEVDESDWTDEMLEEWELVQEQIKESG